MKNKIEFKKTILLSCIVIIVVSAIFQFYLLYQYKVYTGNFNKKIGMIVTNVQNQYPNIDKNELIQILNNQEDVETGLLKQYGINLENDSIIIQNDKMFVKFSIINLCFIIGLAMAVLLIFVKYTNSKDKKLGEITKYIEEINNKNYKLDIEDNTEDELSILKNEVYKTTVMLKEVAENSVNDKINLKNSLSDISHQLKTPLTSMSVMVDNLMDNPEMDYKTRNDFIKDIRRELVNINFLVNSLLKLSKLDANSVHFIKKQVCVQEIINNAIKKASSSNENYEEITYEGYGPNGVAVIVEASTDNKNRTAADVRHVFDKAGGNLGTTGCVSYMFNKKGVIVIEKETCKMDEEELMMLAIESGAEDFEAGEEVYEITTDPSEFTNVCEKLEQNNIEFLEAEVQMVPTTTVSLDEHGVEKMERLIERLDELDDVSNIYHNWEE